MNLWPDYRNESEFIEDYNSFIITSRIEKDKIIEFIS